jgi:transposase
MKRGRHTILTPELREKFMRIIENGNSRRNACDAIGFSESTLYLWLQRAEKEPGSEFSEFSESLKKAEAAAERAAVAVIRSAMTEHWQAAAWFLERKFPENWGRKEKIEHSGPDRGPIQPAIVGGMTREAICKIHIERCQEILRQSAAERDFGKIRNAERPEVPAAVRERQTRLSVTCR